MIDSVWCEINETGHILSANDRFCKLFGFTEEEVTWHYIRDLYRYPQDWESFRNYGPEETGKLCFFVRLKNRAGRSYKCSLERSSRIEDGRVVYHLDIARVGCSAIPQLKIPKNFRFLTEVALVASL